MKDFPRWINTRQDVENLLESNPEDTKAYLRRILDDRLIWVNVSELMADDPGVEDETHRVIDSAGEPGEAAVRFQQERVEDPNAWMFRLGFSVAEVTGLIGLQ